MGVLVIISVLGLAFIPTVMPFQCECGVAVDTLIFPPFVGVVGPVHNFTARPGQCSDAGEVECDSSCSSDFASWAGSLSLTDPRPDDPQGRTWGKYMCDRARASGDFDREAITAELEAWNRIVPINEENECEDFEDWDFVTDEPNVFLCCDQLGNHVDC